MRYPLLLTSLFATSCSVAAAQNNARDAFWSASDLFTVSKNPAKVANTTAPVRRRPVAPAESKTPHVDPVLVAKNGYGEQPHLVRVSADQIGMRYSVLLRGADDTYSEVAPTTTFHSGQFLHLSVMANQPGYLYVVEKGSSGNWQPIFPRRGATPDTNKVEAGVPLEIPSGKAAFQFDQTAGEEKLFLIVSRSPLADLDKTIQGLQSNGAHNTAPPPTRPDMNSYEASNRIPDELINRFKSRDLNLVETTEVNDKKPDNAGEKAVYVVSKGSVSSAGPQVVAELTLHHN